MAEGLQISDIHHHFGDRQVIAGLSLNIGDGEIVCLLGPSGCGKSTTLRLAAGIEELQSGTISVGEQIVAGDGSWVPPEARHIGLVPQDYALFPHLTVEENVAFGLGNKSRDERHERATALLHQVGLARLATAYPHTLSGGEQQRVALARALAPEPRVMLMDEPFSGLDVTTRGAVRRTTRKILRERNVPTLIVTHDPEEAMELADRIAVMRDGVIVQAGPPGEIYLYPADSYVMELFGAPNRFSATVAEGKVETPFGPLPAESFGEGTTVNILFRADAVKLSGDDLSASAVAAKVSSVRLRGAVERTELVLEESGERVVMDRLHGSGLKKGDEVRLTADMTVFHLFVAGD
jgi:iron(III) transport system ATP-binding protein